MSSLKTLGDAVSRRQFLQSSALATAALGMGPLAHNDTLTQASQLQPHAPGPLCLWHDRPAKAWMTEALPIGNGPMGAMLFGGADLERILAAIPEMARATGVFADPAAAAPWAGLKQMILQRRVDPEEVAVCIVSGSGLKDINNARTVAGEPQLIDPTLKAVRECQPV